MKRKDTKTFIGWLFILLFILLTSTHAIAQTCVKPPSDIISWWPGDVNTDDIIGENHGSLVNSAKIMPGFVGKAFDLDGTAGYIEVPHDPGLNPTNAITVTAWINHRSTGYAHPVVKKADQSSGYSLEFGGSIQSAIYFWVNIEGSGWVSSTPAGVPIDQWIHVAGIYDGFEIRLLVNGVPIGPPRPVSGNIVPSSNDLNIGKDPSDPNRMFDGLIDEPTIYNRALDITEIQAIYDAGSLGKCKNLAITSGLLPAQIQGEFFVHQFEATGGTATYSWSIVQGDLPTGLNMNAAGLLEGSPTDTGLFTFTLRVTDSDFNIDEITLELEIKAPPVCVPPSPGIVGWWPLDELSGNIARDIIGNNNGGSANVNAPSEGKVDGAFHFDSVDDSITVPDNDLWAFGANNFTIELWANFDVPGGGTLSHPSDIFIGNDQGQGLQNKWFFALGGGGLEFLIHAGGNHFLPIGPFDPVVGEWYHLAVVRRGSIFTGYVNGLPIGSVIDSTIIPNPDGPLTIGQAEGISPMNGFLDEVAIYNRALTVQEIQSIYDAGSEGKCIPLNIFPNKGGDTGTVSVRINGAGFSQDSTVTLTKDGVADITGESVAVDEDGTGINTTFDLSGKAYGLWNVVVTNNDGTFTFLTDGFTIEEGRSADVWADIVGLNIIRSNRQQTYTVFYGNRGNVDAIWVPLWIGGIPTDSTWKLETEIALPLIAGLEDIDWADVPIQINTPNEIIIPLFVSRIPPGTTRALTFSIATSAQTMALRTWVNPPFFHSPLSPETVECVGAVLTLGIDALGLFGPKKLASCGLQIVSYFATQASSFASATSGMPIFSGMQVFSSTVIGALRFNSNCIVDSIPIVGTIAGVVEVAFDAGRVWVECSDVFGDNEQHSLHVTAVSSWDPNDKIGSQGAGQGQFITGEEPLRYSVFFENVETATAPAQEVIITDQLDVANMDLSTLSLGPIAFGDTSVTPPPGLSSFATDVDLRPDKDLIVRIEANLNPNSGLLTWRFTSLDPDTGDFPDDPLAGFLPPNITPPEGDGSVLFTVNPKEGLPTGIEIRNKALIVFDTNVPIETPEWFNTLDNTGPTSIVLNLASVQDSTDFLVEWSGEDEGSGIRDYAIYVSEESGPFTEWLSNTSDTSGIFSGEDGKIYEFYSVARDRTGNLEDKDAVAEAITDVIANTVPEANAGEDKIWECTGNISTAVTLDGSGSFDPESDALSYEWTWDGGSASGVNPAIQLPSGLSTITLVVNDGELYSVPDTVNIDVQDFTEPVVTVELVPVKLKKKKGDFRVEFSATDICDVDPTISAALNGVSVVNGQIVELKSKKKFKVRNSDEGSESEDSSDSEDMVKFYGPSFTLKVTTTDESGNVGTASSTYVFDNKNRDDNSSSGHHKKKRKKKHHGSDDDSGSGHKKRK